MLGRSSCLPLRCVQRQSQARPLARCTLVHPHQQRLPLVVMCLAATPVSKVEDELVRQQKEAYFKLVELSGTETALEMRPASFQNGLFTKQPAVKGQILMEVPRSAALIIDYNKGISVPSSGQWPRLKQGLAMNPVLNWDLLMALAVLDGLAGDGDAFWQSYCGNILPDPETLTLPMCWSRERLEELQHAAIMEAALQQQERLKGMFPSLMEPVAEDAPSWLQWAFACVRSRAYKLGPDAFAMVPFWDLANHDMEPNADFRASPEPGGPLQLFALKAIEADQEVFISYTGPEGYTNQRLMAQYGFVIPGGNAGDRMPLSLPEGSKSAGLSLEHFQNLMGQEVFVEVITAKNAYGYSALKSMPVADENSESGSTSTSSTAIDLELPQALKQQCAAIMQEFTTTLEQDQEEMERLKGSQPRDERLLATLQYRVERKKLARAINGLLDIYCDKAKELK